MCVCVFVFAFTAWEELWFYFMPKSVHFCKKIVLIIFFFKKV